MAGNNNEILRIAKQDKLFERTSHFLILYLNMHS